MGLYPGGLEPGGGLKVGFYRISSKLNLESLPNTRINTGKDHTKSSKVVHTFAVICDTLSNLLHLS